MLGGERVDHHPVKLILYNYTYINVRYFNFYLYPYNNFLYIHSLGIQCLSSSINVYLTKIEVQMICIYHRSYDTVVEYIIEIHLYI